MELYQEDHSAFKAFLQHVKIPIEQYLLLLEKVKKEQPHEQLKMGGVFETAPTIHT